MDNILSITFLLVCGFFIGVIFSYARLRKVRAVKRQSEQEVLLQAELVKVTARLNTIQQQYDLLDKRCNSLVHDLKSPLVTITGFSDLLQKDLEDGNTEQVTHNLERINTGVEALKSILDEMQKTSMESKGSEAS